MWAVPGVRGLGKLDGPGCQAHCWVAAGVPRVLSDESLGTRPSCGSPQEEGLSGRCEACRERLHSSWTAVLPGLGGRRLEM